MVNPIYVILIIVGISSFLLLGLVFVGNLSDWKRTAPDRFRWISAVLSLVYGILSIVVLRMHFPAHQIQTPPRQQTAIPVVVVTTRYDPTLLTAPDLPYPPAAQNEGIHGKVLLQVTVSPEGKVTAVHIVSGIPVLAAAAKAAVSQNIYKPSPVAGSKPIIKRIEFDFRLAKS